MDGGVVVLPHRTVKAYKLCAVGKCPPHKLYPLFIGRNTCIPVGVWIPARNIPTKGYAPRPGWHVALLPEAAHLSTRGRVWVEVEIPADVDWQTVADYERSGFVPDRVPVGGYYRWRRPKHQGGEWLIAGAMKVVRVLSDDMVAAILLDARGKAA